MMQTAGSPRLNKHRIRPSQSLTPRLVASPGSPSFDVTGLAAAAVGPGDDLHQVTVRILKVQAATAVAVVDHPWLALARVWPVGQVLATDAAKSRVKLFFPYQEGVVLGCDLPGGLG